MSRSFIYLFIFSFCCLLHNRCVWQNVGSQAGHQLHWKLRTHRITGRSRKQHRYYFIHFVSVSLSNSPRTEWSYGTAWTKTDWKLSVHQHKELEGVSYQCTEKGAKMSTSYFNCCCLEPHLTFHQHGGEWIMTEFSFWLKCSHSRHIQSYFFFQTWQGNTAHGPNSLATIAHWGSWINWRLQWESAALRRLHSSYGGS